jgi:hypothetical protein
MSMRAWEVSAGNFRGVFETRHSVKRTRQEKARKPSRSSKWEFYSLQHLRVFPEQGNPVITTSGMLEAARDAPGTAHCTPSPRGTSRVIEHEGTPPASRNQAENRTGTPRKQNCRAVRYATSGVVV